MVRHEGNLFGHTICPGFQRKELREVFGTYMLDIPEGIFPILSSNVKGSTVDVFSGDRNLLEGAQHVSA